MPHKNGHKHSKIGEKHIFYFVCLYPFLCGITPDPFKRTTGRFIQNQSYVSQYDLKSNKGKLKQIGRIKLALVRPNEYNGIVISVRWHL